MLDTTAKRIENGKSATIDEKGGTKSGMKTDDGGMKSGMENQKSGTKIKTVDRILDLINKDNTISITQLSIETNITRSTIQKHIDNLKNKDIIRRDGADKGGKWVIIKK